MSLTSDSQVSHQVLTEYVTADVNTTQTAEEENTFAVSPGALKSS